MQAKLARHCNQRAIQNTPDAAVMLGHDPAAFLRLVGQLDAGSFELAILKFVAVQGMVLVGRGHAIGLAAIKSPARYLLDVSLYCLDINSGGVLEQ